MEKWLVIRGFSEVPADKQKVSALVETICNYKGLAFNRCIRVLFWMKGDFGWSMGIGNSSPWILDRITILIPTEEGGMTFSCKNRV